jgi:hypothetical protein
LEGTETDIVVDYKSIDKARKLAGLRYREKFEGNDDDINNIMPTIM